MKTFVAILIILSLSACATHQYDTSNFGALSVGVGQVMNSQK